MCGGGPLNAEVFFSNNDQSQCDRLSKTIQPKSRRTASDLTMLNVETYGGGLWHTWFDRDLSLAGKVMVRRSGGRLEHKLGESILRNPRDSNTRMF